jgi:hypothetical protein
MITYCLIVCALCFLHSVKITVSKTIASLIDTWGGEGNGGAGN